MEDGQIKISQETVILIQAILNRFLESGHPGAINIPIIMVNTIIGEGKAQEIRAEMISIIDRLKVQFSEIETKWNQKSMQVAYDSILTTTEAIDYLRISKPSFFKYLKLGQIKCIKAGRGYKIFKSELDRFLKADDMTKDIKNVAL